MSRTRPTMSLNINPAHKELSLDVRSIAPNSNVGDEIIPGLFLGSLEDAESSEYLRTNKIDVVISIYDGTVKELSNVKYHQYKISDRSDSDICGALRELLPVIAKCRNRKEVILVHCFAGVSRSATLVCAHLMHSERISSGEALIRIQKKRSKAYPKLGFQIELEKIDRHNDRIRDAKMSLLYNISTMVCIYISVGIIVWMCGVVSYQ